MAAPEITVGRIESDKALLKATIDAQERERQRICLDVHDGVAQNLSRAFHYLQAVDGMRDADLVKNRMHIAAATTEIRDGLREVRGLITRLCPASLSTVGLVRTLDADVNRLRSKGYNVDFAGRLARRLPEDVEIAVYRIMREALTNSEEHAQAKRIWVNLGGGPEEVRGFIKDDGVGFHMPEGCVVHARDGTLHGFGITSMRTRAEAQGGELLVDSALGVGTTITFVMPLGKAS